ncbi:MAG TPA: hypothetical protein PKH69_02885 [Thiobacillaceae bacterium]|nr:hypothetical protein [Thiobacillaceae bacterium]HNU63032.1 hypothetical protein [Thiobacillaceae bacterium]
MSTRSISSPLPGERVLALAPETAAEAAQAWLRRPNLFPGRALDAVTLGQRQAWQAGHLAARGQDWVAGVADGLQVGYAQTVPDGDLHATRLTIERGRGLTVSGEDAVLNRDLECLLADLPVVAPPEFFLDGGGMGPADSPEQAGRVRPRTPGARLGAPECDRPSLPRIGILVLRPVMLEVADIDALNPCERCSRDDLDAAAAYEDWRGRDAVQLLWYPWPNEWIPLPALPATELRNAVAWTVFGAEAELQSGATLPWEEWGLPLAMLALDDLGRPLWLDRASVARQGGRARDARLRLAGGALAADSRLASLWQARIEQLAEQIAAAGEPPPPAGDLADAFTTRLPPVGLLPRNAYDPEQHRSDFFPPGFDLDAAPIPLEQLDLAIRQSAGLAPLDPARPESARILVPVPLASWEPRLLHKEVVDAEFQQTLERFLLVRARYLGARQGLRHRAALLAHALDGQAHAIEDWRDDSLALEAETLSPWGEPPPGGGHRGTLMGGVHQHFFDGAREPFVVNAGESLFAWVYLDPDHPPRALMLQWHSGGNWEHRAYWGEDLIPFGGSIDGPGHHRVGDLPTPGVWTQLKVPAAAVGLQSTDGSLVGLDGMAFTLFDGRAAYGLAGARDAYKWRKWFCNFLPLGARVQGNEAWDLLTANDLWIPFEPHGGVVPSLPELASAAPDDIFDPGGGPQPASLAIPASGFNITYLPQRGWRGHVLKYDSLAETRLDYAKGAPSGSYDRLRVWAYLDELTPPRSLWACVVSYGLDGAGQARGIEYGFMFWGENRIKELNAISPGFKGFEPQTRRAGALPQSGSWTQLELSLPTGAKLEAATRMHVGMVLFLAYDGTLAFSDTTRVHGTIDQANGQTSETETTVWPLSVAGGQPMPAYTPYLNAKLSLRNDLGVLTPTPSSRIGTVRVYTQLMREPLFTRLSGHEQSQILLRGLSGFADYLRSRIDRADDITDFGFAHMQVDMHRLRQMMMSTTDAARLAVSPALAAIAKSDSALVVQGQIKDYLATLKVSHQANVAGAPATASAVPARMKAATPAAVRYSTVSMQAATQARLIRPPRAPLDIVYAAPVLGLSEIRTTAIADRLKAPPSTEARDYALANRHRTVTSLLQLLDTFLVEDSGEVPALLADFAIPLLPGIDYPKDAVTPKLSLTDFRADAALLAALLEPESLGGAVDEAALFTQAVSLSDSTVAMLRQLEGRLALYRDALNRCEGALADLLAAIDATRLRQAGVDDDLAEARHDVGVARALLAEESERIAAVNARRARVLAEEVKFLAYVRPREVDNLLATPTHAVDPGLLEAPVPACLQARADTPEEVLDMLRVVREAPANWFVRLPLLIGRLDKVDHLQRLLGTSALRASTGIAQPRLALAGTPTNGKVASAMLRVASRQAETLAPRLAAARSLDVAAFAGLTWQGLRRQAETMVSFADLAEGGHGSVAREAAAELEDITRVATCLYAGFCAVPPSIRLDWAETLSEFDAAPSLRNLASLPRWSEIGYIDRRQMQAYVDWLFGRIESGQAEAVGLMNDVVRMCLLLASDAPIDRILAGRMARPVTGIAVGARIPLTALEPDRLQVGMHALLYRGGTLVARALVADLGQREIAAQVVHTAAARVDLGDDVRVQYSHTEAISLGVGAVRRTQFR